MFGARDSMASICDRYQLKHTCNMFKTHFLFSKPYSPRYRRVLFMFSSACGRIDVSILKLSPECEYESLTK